MKIQILGTGCAKCQTLARLTQEAMTKISLEAELVKVTDIMEITQMGVLKTPALAVDGKVLLQGGLASVEEIAKKLEGAAK